ncbi:MAG: UPF0236 family protein, partial [Clostridia bacterium]|nr:UPF0236 family protein [Clostridia bacterium]
MAIVTHTITDLLVPLLKEIHSLASSMNVLSLNSRNGLDNYLKILNSADLTGQNLSIAILKQLIENIETEFRNRPGRTTVYHVKSYHPRTILTIFGPLTYYRTFYKNRKTKESYCHVDSFLGLRKYDYFCPYVKALVTEASCDTSFAAAGRHVSAAVGNRVSLKGNPVLISRQTARSFVRKSRLVSPSPQKMKSTPPTLFIMLDEKYIHTQNNEGRDIVVHHAVLFEYIKPVGNQKKRNELVNKRMFSSMNGDLNKQVLDYIDKVYDLEKIQRIYVLGDGANWIKGSVGEYRFEKNEVFFALDKYHFKQALRHITLDDDLSEQMLEHILEGDMDSFKGMCSVIQSQNEHRRDTIEEKKNYVLNNWDAILLSYHDNLTCCMEGQISHNLASLFTARPKGYSKKMLSTLLSARTIYRNGYNTRELFLSNFKKENARNAH